MEWNQLAARRPWELIGEIPPGGFDPLGKLRHQHEHFTGPCQFFPGGPLGRKFHSDVLFANLKSSPKQRHIREHLQHLILADLLTFPGLPLRVLVEERRRPAQMVAQCQGRETLSEGRAATFSACGSRSQDRAMACQSGSRGMWSHLLQSGLCR
jgi:hypothetical protein